ncbi:hypothetical protein K438DRAFT_1842928 [Mycena galopus ATCC 62051]|nr:hypothetical protein K438DRAFT_1842928 [Mycena galopus ATCC 62051]
MKPIRKTKARVKVEPTKIPALSVNSKTPKVFKTESSSISFTPAAAADVNGLPAFIGRTWTSRFLPAAYRELFESNVPMMLGAVGTDPETAGKETVAILQQVLNAVYPDVEYTMEWGDAICSRAVARIGERRSAIARTGIHVVDHGGFDTDPKYSTSQVIVSDAKYAIRVNGPAFWKSPTPEHLCQLNSKNPEYIKPTGYLESKAVIATVSPFIKDHDWQIIVSQDADGNDIVDHSRLPVGLLGMAAASVERGYKLYTTGVRVLKPPEFSASAYGNAVTGFIAGIKKFKASRWQSILEACGASIAEPVEEAEDPDESLDGRRESMYIPSSPL